MDIFLGKVTQHAMNYAIRSGIAITSTYAIRQCSRLLKTVDDTAEFQELQNLQERLDSKIRIISPAIDMIELISARGNTSLESAVLLTKALRWDIQSLAVRLAKAAGAEELSRLSSNRANTRAHHEAELRLIVEDIRKLLLRIEDAVPLINLAITTSGASLSTTLPATVSPSRLLQASTFLTAGDTQFSIEPNNSVQVGPAFVLSLYMLFAGHAYRSRVDEGDVRDTTWKEIIHKARVKLIRIPLVATYGHSADSVASPTNGTESDGNATQDRLISGEGKANEFAYRLEIIEDLDDDRVHSFEDNELQPGPYKDVQLAGIRELVPIHEISKIFYADTGKILNIGSDGEANSPVLLLKRDVDALPPRRMMERSEREHKWNDEPEEVVEEVDPDDSQTDIDYQLHQESSIHVPVDNTHTSVSNDEKPWRFPPNLDPEWLAFEVYTESEDENSGDEQDTSYDSAYASGRPSSAAGKSSVGSEFSAGLANLHVDASTSKSISVTERQISNPVSTSVYTASQPPPFGPIRSSLSLLEMLIRLTALQQFQQASHLAIPDELLTFFLEESSTTGAGGDGEERRRKRQEARQKVGFDPYDESPVKRRGEDYQYRNQSRDTHGDDLQSETPYYDYESRNRFRDGWSREPSTTPQSSPEPWLLRSREHPSGSPRAMPDVPSSPQSPYVPPRRATRPLDHIQQIRMGVKTGSPLGRGMSAETDSSLGTSPGTPSLGGEISRGEER